jgi:hypothetical protein
MLKLLKYGYYFKKSALPDVCPAEINLLQLRSNGHNVDQLGSTEISSELHGQVGDNYEITSITGDQLGQDQLGTVGNN